MFNNGSEFKRYFTPFIKDLSIKTVCVTSYTPQDNDTVERVHQVIYKTLVIKYFDKKVFE